MTGKRSTGYSGLHTTRTYLIELVDEPILYGVTHQFCIALHSHFFQNTRPIRADGLYT
jgi:hypothetical protein